LKFTFVHHRYFLGGFRPRKTTNHKILNILISTNSEKNNISKKKKTLKNQIYAYSTFPQKLETIYDYSKGARGLCV